MFCLCSHAVIAGEPEDVALKFLEKIGEGSLDLEVGGDTALHGATSETKRRQIRRDIRRLREELRRAKLEVGEVRVDGDFAAVIVLKPRVFDSAEAQVFPVALVQRGGDWWPAPVLASFENAVEAYTLPIQGRLTALEEWMMRTRVTALGDLIDESASRLRRSIAEAIPEDLLKNGTPGEIAGRFVTACQGGDALAILGFLGGLSDPLPEDWELRVTASQAAAKGANKPDSPWHLLASPVVVRVKVLEDLAGTSPIISYGCLDPRRAGSRGTLGIISIVHLSFERDSAGRWRIDLPDALMNDDAKAMAQAAEFDVDLLDKFPEIFRQSTPLAGAKTLALAETAVIEKLESGDLSEFLSLVDFGKGGKNGRIACAEAAELWWSVRAPRELRLPLRLDSKREGSLAVVAYQWFSPLQPDRYELQTLYFKKHSAGWVLTPGTVPDRERKAQQTLSEWAKTREEDWRMSWRARLFAKSTRLTAEDGRKPPTDPEARQVVADWIAALKNRRITRAMALCAWFGEEGEIPLKALRNLSYELANDATGKSERKIVKLYRQGRWVALHVRKTMDDTAGNSPPTDSLITVLLTKNGAKVIPELDLLAEDSRTRRFLNKETFKHLKASAGEAASGELKALFEAFLEDLGPR